MTVNTINIAGFIYGKSDIKEIKIIFVESWTTENLLAAFGKRYYKDPMRGLVDAVYSMDGPALTMNHADGLPVIVFDQNNMTMGDISYQVNIIFDHIAEAAGDVKSLTNSIYEMYLQIIEEEVTETKEKND